MADSTHTIEPADVAAAFDDTEANGRTTTKQTPTTNTTTKQTPTTNTTTETTETTVTTPANVELEALVDDNKTNASDFQVLTRDVTFTTKVKLLLWKNIKIQFLRRPKSCCCKCCIPVFIMLLMAMMTFIEGIRPAPIKPEFGPEFEYILSNTGDAAQYGNSPFSAAYLPNTDHGDNIPWTDTSIANEWIHYIACSVTRWESGIYDKNIPSYLAIVSDDYENNENLNQLLNILSNKYGNSNTYPQAWLTDKYMNPASTWSEPFIKPTHTTSAPSSNTTTPTAPATTANPTEFFTTNRRRNLLQIEEENPYCNINPLADSTSSYNASFIWYFPPKCQEFSCKVWSRDTTYLNFTEGSLLKFFNNEQELSDYIGHKSYGNLGYNFENTNPEATRPIGAAIVFKKTGGDNGLKWEYKLRFNSSNVPPTEGYSGSVDIFTKSNSELFEQGLSYYLQTSGLPWLQTWLDEGIIELSINKQYSNNELIDKLSEFKSKTTEYSKGVFQFPSYGYKQDYYWTYIGDSFPFFLFIMFCYPIITVLSILVEEKRSKIKEGMKMMGATTTAYWTSWTIWFFIEFTGMALLVSILGSGFGVFRYTDFGIVFLWFWLFCLSSAAFAMMFSTIFDNPKTASLVGLIVFFAVLIGAQSHGSLDMGGKNGLCLLGPACFVISVDTLTQYETSAIGLNWDNINDEYGNFIFANVYIMMFIDIIIYLLLTIYLDQVFPSNFGQKQVFYFFLLPSYWRKKFGCNKNERSQQLKLQRTMSENLVTSQYEQLPDHYKDTDAAIAIRKLSKFFKSFGLTEHTRKEVRAVDNISLDMYKGEVFCLLGHNGAGKTTTISMLTGLLEITSGTAWIMNNNISDSQSMSEIRKHLGVCPQHDVLWDKLTVTEHLWLFARLKGVPTNMVTEEVNKICESTGLSVDGNNNKFPPQMSGGQKRKLSLGIALIGGSQIVFLDEPTSGMDPQSRRITWDLISKEKRNRCMVLTTHFMDEADILGDRIAIMGGGKIKCCGSALFLKQEYGVGYTFTVSLESNDEVSKDIDIIKKKVDTFVFDNINKAEDVALAGSELTYRLPFEETAKFSELFDILDNNKDELFIKSYGISVTTLEEVFLKIGHDEIDDEVDYDSKEVEKDLKVGMDENDKHAAQDQFKQPGNVSTFALQNQNAFQIFFIHVYAVLYKRFWWSIRDFKALVCSLFCPVVLSGMALGLLTITIASNQPEIQLSTTPTFNDDPNHILIHSSDDINNNLPPNSHIISDNFYSSNNTLYDTYINYLQDLNGEMLLTELDIDVSKYFNWTQPEMKQCTKFEQVGPRQWACTNSTEVAVFAYPFYTNISHSFQQHLLDSPSDEYISFLFFPYSMTPNNQKRVYFGVNGSAYHSLPITINLWNNWIWNDIMGDDIATEDKLEIVATMHPLPVTTRQDLISGQLTGFFSALYLVIAFSFIPAGAIYFMVNEKTNLTKHQQLVSGISFIAYWVSNYIADIMIGLPASILVFLSVYVFNAEAFQDEAAGPFFLTLVMFLFSAIPFTYLLSFLFSAPAKAQLGTILLYIIFGMILGLVSFILDQIPSTQDTNSDLKGLYRIFPVYIMCESLLNISLKPLFFPFDDYNDWKVCGRNYLLMFIEGVGYFLLVLLLEYLSTFPALLSKFGFVTNRPITEQDSELDIDVLNEKKRILDAIIYDENGNQIGIDKEKCDDTVVITGLRKVYDPAGTSRILPCCSNVNDEDKIEAVKHLYFGVKKSEVFGYLGVNGAGKTTTLATLTGERYPSSGAAYISNFPISNQLQCRRYVGYCPQFDAIFELLSAAEHLKFYAMIKGLRGAEANKQVDVLLSALTLNKYANRLAGTYSGGNKRKLSVAVSMIGNPPVIFLDEPSTGMDPVSRRFMWEFISTTMSGRCVILTTHSMEECEALCNRVGIMVNGQLKCIGTAQHLKSRYGKGYQLDITLTQLVTNNDDQKEKDQQLDVLKNELMKNFGNINMIEFNGSRISYELIKDNKQLKLGQMFNILENMKTNKFKNIIQAYALSQTTLEQIFIRMAKQGEEEQREKENLKNNQE